MEGLQDQQNQGQQSQEQTMAYIIQQLQNIDVRLAEQSKETRALQEHVSSDFYGTPQDTTATQPPLQAPTSQSTSQAPRASGAAPKRAKLPDPTKFNGDRFAYPAFEEQLLGKLEVDGAYLGGQAIQVNYAFGLLEGQALEFMRPWMQSWRNTAFFTVNSFLTQLRGGYEDPELQETARQKLEELRQGDRSVIDYLAEFDKTFLEARSHGLPAWAKINAVRKGLNRKMGRLLVTVKEPSDYSSWCAELKGLARKDDSEGHRASRLPRYDAPRPAQCYISPPVPSFPPASRFPPIQTPPAPEVEMTLGTTTQRRRAAWVSPEEVARRLAEGLCRRCGGAGHYIRNCPFLPARRPTPTTAALQTTITGYARVLGLT